MNSNLLQTHVAPILGAIKSTGMPEPQIVYANSTSPRMVQPFITISREAGAGGITLANALVARLNSLQPDDRPWQSFDRELIEKIAADHKISQELVANLLESSHNWLTEFFSGASLRDHSTPSEIRVFHSVAATVRALAQAGRVVMVGCGSGFIAGNMPGGLHIRLVAEWNFRVNYMARFLNISQEKAAREVHQRDASRTAFFKRFFPDAPLDPEHFTITFKASSLTEEQMVAAIAAVLSTRPA